MPGLDALRHQKAFRRYCTESGIGGFEHVTVVRGDGLERDFCGRHCRLDLTQLDGVTNLEEFAGTESAWSVAVRPER